MNKIKFLTLSVLYDNDVTSPQKGMTSYKIQEVIKGKYNSMDYTSNYIRLILNEFLKKGFVSSGWMERRSKTYYLTQNGIDFLESCAAQQ